MHHLTTKQILIHKYKGLSHWEETDLLAVEEPLEIRLEFGPIAKRKSQNISITMRTPGADEDLATGFLFTEGIVRQASDIYSVKVWGENMVMVSLQPDFDFDIKKLERHFYTSSSCGVCGKASMDAVKVAVTDSFSNNKSDWEINPEIIYALPDTLRQAQSTFDATGGLHACAIFDLQGNLLALREDVGRHNALDKLIGHYLQQGMIPLDQHILLLSGRASFELLQKAAMAGIRFVCAVGAPSSLAVETAETFGITLIGFLREGRFNVYSGLRVLRGLRNVERVEG
ncbi:MAG: formate dehydrogenase accessory sulfurtransferase FdhD [Phycisphaerae bacterium]|nr:formate dehydrogenase accessory sulfurtransferase FdhD [Saprospiraceae bacterium]